MIIRTEKDVTPAVLAEIERADDPRLREILSAFIRHLHGFIREVRLTEPEFQAALSYIVALGQRTTESHNEATLMAGSLGVSNLVCLLNNAGSDGTTTANTLGPFWRPGAPMTENGASIVRSPTPGDPLFVTARVEDEAGVPVEGAEVEVWHSSTEGFYENQDPGQADMNLRGRFVTDAEGRIHFRTIKPEGYPIPVDGPVGDLVRALGRANLRPAHLHFLIHKEGLKTQVSQVYVGDDPHLEHDVQFGVTERLIGDYVRHDGGDPPAPDAAGAWYTLDFTFRVEPGERRLPRPPITGKAIDGPPPLERLARA